MNDQDTLQLIEQYQNSGGDMNNILGYLTSLASNGKTPLGLNQWQRSDKPVMDDFNEDNRIIDENIRGLWEQKANKAIPRKYDLELSSGVKKYASCDYFKTEDNVVTVNIIFTLTETINDMLVIATLPAGFRPAVHLEVPITVRGGSTNASLAFRTDGTIAFYPYAEAQSERLCYAPTTSFLAV